MGPVGTLYTIVPWVVLFIIAIVIFRRCVKAGGGGSGRPEDSPKT